MPSFLTGWCKPTCSLPDRIVSRLHLRAPSLENIDVEVYHAMIREVRREVGALHDYFELKRKVLKVDRMRSWDLLAPLSNFPASRFFRPIDFEEAINIVLSRSPPRRRLSE